MRGLLLPAALLAGALAHAQPGLDNGGNSYLNGRYFFRWVAYSGIDARGVIRQATAAHGVIAFDGAGSYRLDGQVTDSLSSPGQAVPLVTTGTYVVASSGMAEIQNPLRPGETLYAGVGAAAAVGSSTEKNHHDVFVAVPAPGGETGTGSLNGTYLTGMFGFLEGSGALARSAFFTMRPDGAGGVPAFAARGRASAGQPSTVVFSQTVTGATYSLSPDGSGTLTFPNSDGAAPGQLLLSGAKAIYLSADGEAFIGGSATGFDILVGLRGMEGNAAAAFQGSYFTAGMYHQELSSGSVSAHTFRGSLNARAGILYMHGRFNAVPDIPVNHYDSTIVVAAGSFDSAGTQKQADFYRAVGAQGRMFLQAGGAYNTQLVVGVQARPVSGAGVFLNPHGVVNAANLAPSTNPLAPGQFVSLFGSGFSSSSATASSAPLPTTLAGVQVRVNGRLAPLSYVGPDQINAILPYATTEPYARLQVVAGGRESNTVTLYTRASAPGVYTVPPGGAGLAVALHADYSLVSESSGARQGETVMLFLTGLGAVSPATADGSAAGSTPLSMVPEATRVAAYINGLAAPVTFAGLAPGFAGLYQINLRIPSNVSLVFPVGGSAVQPLDLEIDTLDAATMTSIVVDIRRE
jgi:uncharacterized protein (TIGR03437 family)